MTRRPFLAVLPADVVAELLATCARTGLATTPAALADYVADAVRAQIAADTVLLAVCRAPSP